MSRFFTENKVLEFLVELMVYCDKNKRVAFLSKCFEVFQFFVYNLRDNGRGSLGTLG